MSHGLVLGGFFNQGFLHALIMLALAFLIGFALVDLVRRPMTGVKKCAWVLIIVLVPVIGAIIYLVVNGDAAYSGSDDRAGMTQQGQQDMHISEIQHPGI
jgi:Phospholipase_D-nuclease N-terminal